MIITLALKNKTNEVKKQFNAVSINEETTPEQASVVLEARVTAVTEDAGKQARAEYEELEDVTDSRVLEARGIHTLTSGEAEFYNEVEKAGGFNEDLVWPEAILERVFEGLQEERPLLKIINFTPSVGKAKITRSHRKGVAAWGPPHKDIEGKLGAQFGATEFNQLALTAFFLISNDALELGPRWVDRYARLCLSGAIAETWEKAIISGSGHNRPIGLIGGMNAAIDPTNGYADEELTGILTFKDSQTMVKKFAMLSKKASKYTDKIGDGGGGEERPRKVKGNVYLIVDPLSYYNIVTRATTQNANDVFVSNLPFTSEDHIIEPLEVKKNKLIAFVGGEYDAVQSRAGKIHVHKETFIMKRAILYTTNLLGNGEPANNDAAQICDIKIDDGEPATK